MTRVAHALSLPIAGACLAFLTSPLQAQSLATRTGVALPELRIDLTSGDITSAQLGAGVQIRSGTYFRLAALAGVGVAWRDGVHGSTGRVELQGRFHLDPFREARYGIYGIGGVAAIRDSFEAWQARLIVGAGVELPAHGRATMAIEAALAGGIRLSLIARRLALGRR